METYISELQSSTIALPAWGVVIFWLIIFASAQVLFRTARSFSQAQDFVVTSAVSISLNLRSILFLRSLSQPGAARGSVTFSNHLAVKDLAFQLFGAAAFCLILGILLAHLALFGGAFFLLATAFGYLRRTTGKTTNEPPALPTGSC